MRLVMTRVSSIFLSLAFCLWLPSSESAAETNAPNRGPVRRARVVMVQAPNATVTFNPQPDKIPPMIQRGLTNLTGRATPKDAWLSLISTQDTIGGRRVVNYASSVVLTDDAKSGRFTTPAGS